MRIYLSNNSVKFHPDPKRRGLGLFEERRHSENNKMSSDPDPKPVSYEAI